MNTDRLNGLVLAGGKSSRMGTDKSLIRWHGVEQMLYVADLIKPFCEEVFISRRRDQNVIPGDRYRVIVDGDQGVGPYRGILSAFAFDPTAAWLIVACDLPLTNKQLFQQLVAGRNKSAMATTFVSPFDGLPEPLITIWEPKSYAAIEAGITHGYTCPRKLLINSDNVSLLHAEVPDTLLNVNTPVEAQYASNVLNPGNISNGS